MINKLEMYAMGKNSFAILTLESETFIVINLYTYLHLYQPKKVKLIVSLLLTKSHTKYVTQSILSFILTTAKHTWHVSYLK